MAFNLLDTVTGLFNNKDLIGKAASSFGESEGGIQKALSGVIPSVLTGLLQKSSSADGISSVLNMARGSSNSGVLGNISGLLGGGSLLTKGMDMVKGLFGDKAGSIITTLSGFAGIKESSVSSLLSMAAPASLGAVGKYAQENNLGASGLLSFLNTQKDSILGSVPPGLNLAGALGLGSLGSIGSKLSGAMSGITGGVKDLSGSIQEKASGGSRWLLPLILILAAIALIWYFMRSCNKTADVPPAMSTAPLAPVPAPSASMPEMIKVTLPDGVVLDAYKGGIEDQLVTFLGDPSKNVDKNTWFDFDNLNFETGSATITPESMKQIGNISAILKAFPKASLKIGGYTDRTGDSLSNLKLSQSRATAVLTALKSGGAGNSQLDGAEGYGSQFAKVAADASDEERKMDRRIAVSVRKK